jgi:hypothetical protein
MAAFSAARTSRPSRRAAGRDRGGGRGTLRGKTAATPDAGRAGRGIGQQRNGGCTRRSTCEHTFVYDSDGSPYPRLKRAITAGNLAIIEATAAELGWVALRDALGILLVIEAKEAERFERSAVRWAGRLALEVPDLVLAELAGVLESL